MPSSIVDFSAISAIIRDEPWMMHFWEATPTETLEFLKNPRAQLAKMGIDLPADCRIETTIENHDWIATHTNNLTSDDDVKICNTGNGNTAKSFYKVTSYAHLSSEVGKHQKKLLHGEHERERK